MANEHLRASIHAAGLTVQELSEKIQVDPKTVERWITKDRTPHRANRQEVARALNRDEAHLWPEEFNVTEASARAEIELVRIYPSRGAVPSSMWVSAIESAHTSIDFLAFAGSFLHDAVPGFVTRVHERARAGASVRMIFGDPTSNAVAVRGREEGIGDSLADRCRLTWKYLAPLRASQVELRMHSCTLYNSIFRFDNEVFVNHHQFGAAASSAPVFHIRNCGNGGLFQGYLNSLEATYSQAVEPPKSVFATDRDANSGAQPPT